MRVNDDDHDLEIQAAWLYYMHGLGQEKIARKLSVSRTKVVRMLSRARETGLVKISIEHQMAETIALADWIAQNYGLKKCILTPAIDDSETPIEQQKELSATAVGHVAAQELTRRVLKQKDIIIGVGAGSTVKKTVESLRLLSRPQAKFVQLIGSSQKDDGSSAYALALQIATIFEGSAITLPAPFYVSDPAIPPLLRNDNSIRTVLDMTTKTNLNILSCSPVEMTSNFVTLAELTPAQIQEAKDSGAVCEIAGLLLDATGARADCDLNELRMGIELETLRQADNTVIAAGREKIGAVHAVLNAKIAQHLIIDHEIALGLVKAKTDTTL